MYVDLKDLTAKHFCECKITQKNSIFSHKSKKKWKKLLYLCKI